MRCGWGLAVTHFRVRRASAAPYPAIPTYSPLDRLSRMRWGSTMHGNVWEWVEDSWRENYDVAPTDDVTFGLPRRNPTFRITMCTIMISWRGIRA
jgi:Sulfatase-modifying factor enzyme 1